ncbi:hypothetical protein [Paucisalibacillus globulus]|nr:hypothetical protein [Paucisalibacillus globulus]
MRKLLIVLFVMIILGFGVVGVNQQLNEPEGVIKPANSNTISIQS